MKISDGIYTSNGVKKRISNVSKDREYAINYRKNQLLEKQPPNNPQTMPQSKVKESKVKESKEDKSAHLEKAISAFREDVLSNTQYPKDMLKSFFDYWSEKTPSKTKCKWQQQQTWETPKRLAYWAKRGEKFNTGQQKPISNMPKRCYNDLTEEERIKLRNGEL